MLAGAARIEVPRAILAQSADEAAAAAEVSGGVEMLVGVTDDPTFGAVMVCASGGILAELVHDADFRLHPLTARDADEMIASLRGAALLKRHRGSPPVQS